MIFSPVSLVSQYYTCNEWGDSKKAEIYLCCVYEPSAHSCQTLPLHHFMLKTTSL